MDVIKATVCMNDDCGNKAVMDLVFGEEVEQVRVPWCAHCICPDTWDLHPFHHAESYSQDWEAPAWKEHKCFIDGCPDTPIVISHYESKGGKWKDARPFCAKHFKGDHPHTAYVPNSQMHFIKAEPIEKEPQCTKCGEPANVAALGDMYCTPCYNASLKKEDKADTLGVILEETQKIISNIAEEIREVFTLKLPSSAGTLGTEHLVPKFESKSYDSPTKEQLECEAAKLSALKEDFNKTVSEELEARAELYNRQPHYEGGIDPITYGKDNFTPEEMNGFYKMNVVKYVSRCDRKNGLEDLKKAQDYLNLLINQYEEHSTIRKVEEDVRKKQELTDEAWREHERKENERKHRVAAYKAVWHTEEEEEALKEAELCVQAFHNREVVQIKRQDVLDIVQDKLKGEDYTMLVYGDGETFIEKNPCDPKEDVHAKRPFKDVINDLLCDGTLTLKRPSINYWGDAIENYLQKHNYSYSMAEGDDFMTYILERA